MLVLFNMEQCIVFLEHFDDVIISLKHMFTGKNFSTGKKAAIVANRIINLEVVFAAENEVILTVPGRGVNCPSTRLEGNVLADDDQ